MNKIVYVDSDFLIAFKDHVTSTVPLKCKKTGDTLLDFVASDYPEVLAVSGKNPWEGGALHRLDNQTSGLVVFARTQHFYDKLSTYQKEGEFVKIYRAETDGFKVEKKKISSYFRAFGPKRKMVKAESDISKSDNQVLYTTEINEVGDGIFECIIAKGFRHQIRVHLASCGCPIKGDRLYNPSSAEEYMHLECFQVSWPGFTYRAR